MHSTASMSSSTDPRRAEDACDPLVAEDFNDCLMLLQRLQTEQTLKLFYIVDEALKHVMLIETKATQPASSDQEAAALGHIDQVHLKVLLETFQEMQYRIGPEEALAR